MKSAYELAMERLEQASGPSRKLTEDQKAKIADLEKVYEAKIAETRLSFEARLQTVTTHEELQQVQAELADKIAALELKREQEKESVWNS